MPQVIPQTLPDYDATRIIERPDGFYWQAKSGTQEYGPFPTLLEAAGDMSYTDEDTSYEPGESLADAEKEMGIADWIDAETGLPAEENGTRTEEH